MLYNLAFQTKCKYNAFITIKTMQYIYHLTKITEAEWIERKTQVNVDITVNACTKDGI